MERVNEIVCHRILAIMQAELYEMPYDYGQYGEALQLVDVW